MKRIICIGNRYAPEDRVGPRTYDRLSNMALPPEVEVIDGGLAGLDLLRFVEGAETVIFVDSVSGFALPNQTVILSPEDVAPTAPERHDHSAGLAYLLRVLPEVCEGDLPQILLIGVEGHADDKTIDEAADLALKTALEGGMPTHRSKVRT